MDPEELKTEEGKETDHSPIPEELNDLDDEMSFFLHFFYISINIVYSLFLGFLCI